jgi:hypothetical protein
MWALGLDLNTLITYMCPCKWCETDSGYVYVKCNEYGHVVILGHLHFTQTLVGTLNFVLLWLIPGGTLAVWDKPFCLDLQYVTGGSLDRIKGYEMWIVMQDL